jgi:hypothetical protein
MMIYTVVIISEIDRKILALLTTKNLWEANGLHAITPGSQIVEGFLI